MGDGILSSFQSASDAVQCAKEISLEISNTNISLRIGIHLGEVVFEDGDVFGDGVNMASGLQELADPGTVYISGAVQKEIRNIAHIHTEFIAEKILKNLCELGGKTASHELWARVQSHERYHCDCLP